MRKAVTPHSSMVSKRNHTLRFILLRKKILKERLKWKITLLRIPYAQ
jgi:hypothetical protein